MEKGAYSHQYRKVGGWLFPFCLSVVLLFLFLRPHGAGATADGMTRDCRGVGRGQSSRRVSECEIEEDKHLLQRVYQARQPHGERSSFRPRNSKCPKSKAGGKHIQVELLDSLKPNTTYTIDFSDAISGNNENNPMGSYTYSFSTGEAIDTMEVSGYVLEPKIWSPSRGGYSRGALSCHSGE